MGRGRAKGNKKQSSVASRDGAESIEDEKLPVRRRGRPLKLLKGEILEEDKIVKIEDEEKEENDMDEAKNSVSCKSATENGRKRKMPSLVETENTESMKDENVKTNATGLIKAVGFRQNGSRRKNKPCRAAEVGVECI